MKRLLSLLLTASLLLGLSACALHTQGNTGAAIPPVSDTQEPPPADEATTPDEPTPPPTDESTELPSDEGETDSPVEDDPPSVDPGTEDPGENAEEPVEEPRTIDPYAPMVALTFDDGPHELYSNQILDVLEQYNAVATFFEVGYNAVRYPEILVRMAELGCEIASHSYYHHDLTTLSKDAMLTDLAKLDTVIYNATGIMPTLVRPPYGAVNSMVKYQSGRAMILWTVDTQDWRYRDAQTLIEYIQNYGNLDGEIVLMHSIHGSTAEAMTVVIPWLIEQGYQLVTVSELMAYYYGELLEANKYYNQTWFARHDRTEFPLELPDEPMQTQIPEYTTVPVVPTPPPSEPDTPDTPEQPSENPEQPPETDPETPPQEDEGTIAPEDPVIPPEDPNDPPAENEGPNPEEESSPTEDTSPADNNETDPPENEPSDEGSAPAE